jgi:uncharacterized coiled-coil protein SlyX
MKYKSSSGISSAACALLLCACAAKPLPPAPPPVCPPTVAAIPVVVTDPDLRDLLNYQAGLRPLASADLVKALQDLNMQGGAARVVLRRAMVLAALRGNGDLARAQAQAEIVLQSGLEEEQNLKPLAQSLASAYAEMRRQDETIDRLNQQVREAQRRNDQLNDKLEALKNIERTLSLRPAPPPPPAPLAPK